MTLTSKNADSPASISGACVAGGATTPMPLGSDEVYLLGLPWEPWLAYDSGLVVAGDSALWATLVAAAGRIRSLPLAAAMRRLWHTVTGRLARHAG